MRLKLVVLNEFLNSSLKRVSKELGYDSCKVLLDFLKEDIKEPNGTHKDVLIEEEGVNGDVSSADEIEVD